MPNQLKLLETDPFPAPYESDIAHRTTCFHEKKAQLAGENASPTSFASGHLFYGFHRVKGGWVYCRFSRNLIKPGTARFFALKTLENHCLELIADRCHFCVAVTGQGDCSIV